MNTHLCSPRIYLDSLREQIANRTKHSTLVLDEMAWCYLARVRMCVSRSFTCMCVTTGRRGDLTSVRACPWMFLVHCLREALLIRRWRLFSVINHWTCSLGCVCMCVCVVCDSSGMSRLGINIKQCISLPYAEIGRTASINRLLILSSSLISLNRNSAKQRQHRLSTSVSSSLLSWDQIRQYVLSLWCKPEARATSRQQIPDLQSIRSRLRPILSPNFSSYEHISEIMELLILEIWLRHLI